MKKNIILLILTYLVAILDRGNLGLAALYMQKSLMVSDNDFSFAISIFYFSYVIFAIPSLLILRKIGFRSYLVISLILWGTITFAISLSTNIYELISCRALLGIVESGIVPTILVYMSSYNKNNKLYFTNLLFMCIPFGVSLSGLIGIIAYSKIFIHFNYHVIFIIEGLISYILAIIIYFCFSKNIHYSHISRKITFNLNSFKPFQQSLVFMLYGFLWVYIYLQLTILVPIILNKHYMITPLYNAKCNLLLGMISIFIVMISSLYKSYFNLFKFSVILFLCIIILVLTNNIIISVVISGIQLGILVILISNLFVSINNIVGSESNKIVSPTVNTFIELGSMLTPFVINYIMNIKTIKLDGYFNLVAAFILVSLSLFISKWNKNSQN